VLNIIWFKRDQRIHDHAALAQAAAAGPVLPIYIAEPDFWMQPDASARQWHFAAECLAGLQSDLGALGQPLRIFVGDAVPVLQAIATRHKVASLWSHEETGNGWTFARDRRVAAWAQGTGIAWHELRQTGVVRRLKSRDGWAKAWDAEMAKPITPPPAALTGVDSDWPTRIPTASCLGLADDPCPHRQRGGRQLALQTLDSFLSRRGRDYRYQMSSPVTAFDASSRLSPHIAWGTLSMREVAQATWARLRGLSADTADTKRWRGSLISFSGRQHWHCHFMQKLEDAPRLEFENLHRGYDGLRPNAADPARLAAYCAGATGYPFVDACMRALRDNGWINFRMRAMLMSFASYHLWLPWRETGLHLARQFVDYEPGIHWPQVQMQSGTTGINTMRVYNPVKQGYDQDASGIFVRRFVPELAAVPDAFLQEPWRWDGARLLAYPSPIVDHLVAAQAARAALSVVRKATAHRVQANEIAQKHGSRKAGIPMTGRPRRVGSGRALATNNPDQLTLKL
jgi:deoxyribodipyrimidine photo-lyase